MDLLCSIYVLKKENFLYYIEKFIIYHSQTFLTVENFISIWSMLVGLLHKNMLSEII